MDPTPYYHHAYWCFPFFGLFFAFLLGGFIGRRMAWRRMWMASQYPGAHCGPCMGRGPWGPGAPGHCSRRAQPAAPTTPADGESGPAAHTGTSPDDTEH